MQQLKKFTQGPPELVKKLNDMVDAVNQMQNLIGDGVIKVQNTVRGKTIGLDINQVRKRMSKSSSSGDGGGTVRRAITTTAAGASTTITANLYDSNGSEQTTGDESGITVYFSIVSSTGGGGNLNACLPQLKDDTDIFIVSLPYDSSNNRWYYIGTVQSLDTC